MLLVEGGRIDHAHHAGNAARALEDTVAFNEAIKVALEKTKREDTLIVVTADHSHTLTINGYPKRGNPILDKVVNVAGEFELAGDGKPYTTLAYAKGPGGLFPPLAKGEDKTKASRPPAKPMAATMSASSRGVRTPTSSAARSSRTTSTTCRPTLRASVARPTEAPPSKEDAAAGVKLPALRT